MRNVIVSAALILIGLFCTAHSALAQVKQIVDEELLSQLVQAKQEEVKARALTNLVLANASTLNKTTYNTIYDMVDILLTEKNKTVMTRGLVAKASDYALAYASTRYLMQQEDVFTGAVSFKGSTWVQIRANLSMAYDKAQGINGTTGKVINIGRVDTKQALSDPTTVKTIGVDNWLLDQMYIRLARSTKLKQRGFFKVESARTWQYDTLKRADVDYESFWEGNIPERTRLTGLIDSYLVWLEGHMDQLDQVAKAVEDIDWKGLNDLDLTTLSQTPGTVGNVKVAAAMKLFLKSVDLYRYHVGQNSTIVRIADIITDHIIFEPEVWDENALYGFSIDVEGIILSLEDKLLRSTASPTKNSWFNVRPFFTIGINYGVFAELDSAFATEDRLGIQQIAWAGEKLGLKWQLWDWKYTRGQQAGEPFRFHGRMWTRNVRPRDPVVSNWYLSLYASGLLYTIADLRSEAAFNYPIIGSGTGVRFFNGLELNVSYAAPMIPNVQFSDNVENGFWNVGIDIPIFEYIRAVRARNGKV